MKTDLLWVYEGLTQYLGALLTARSGLWSAEEYRENLAWVAAYLDQRTGRAWRPLVDTAVSAQLLYGAREEWEDWRRRVDFYDEMLLIWLEADTVIRQQSQGQKSLDDFCRRFHGAPSGPPAVKTYTFEDVVAELNAVCPHDWRAFLTSRVNSTASHGPLGGVEASGWRLVFTEEPNRMRKAGDSVDKSIDLRFSIGLILKQDGRVKDVIPGKPAAEAGMAPAMKLLAVNGRRWTEPLLREAVKATKEKPNLELMIENGDFIQSYVLKYQGGERYPHLERDAVKPDLLQQIIQPLKVR
jgi:predicted metalloprotease with PDZ domain